MVDIARGRGAAACVSRGSLLPSALRGSRARKRSTRPAAAALRDRLSVPVIEPIPESVRYIDQVPGVPTVGRASLAPEPAVATWAPPNYAAVIESYEKVKKVAQQRVAQ